MKFQPKEWRCEEYEEVLAQALARLQMTCGDGRLQRGLRCKNQDVMLLEPSICSSQPSTRAAKPHCGMRTVPVGIGGTELASFSSLVIQQPLEGAGALPLSQDVENPRQQA